MSGWRLFTIFPETRKRSVFISICRWIVKYQPTDAGDPEGMSAARKFIRNICASAPTFGQRDDGVLEAKSRATAGSSADGGALYRSADGGTRHDLSRRWRFFRKVSGQHQNIYG